LVALGTLIFFSNAPLLQECSALQEHWVSKAMPKLKVFLWTLMLDRLNTQVIMLRKKIEY
jgi:hypothetical protein